MINVIFDFLYYLLYKVYAHFNERSAKSTAAAIVGGMQAMNVLTVVMLIQSIVNPKGKIGKLIAVVLFIFFQVVTYIRYMYRKSYSVKVIEKEWLEVTESARERRKVFFFLYGAISIVGFFGLAIYLGFKKIGIDWGNTIFMRIVNIDMIL
ncbi:hypothetical protein [Chitinophaga sp. XS-30]|uniref:hypothetical protein n=1 Tax=Chitinophaga sp. XS-30 TaxID=2604421 RepID=UPI0011DCA339|nr:hypothetical protein [Chitinophaga sp. XS-30]QEH41140.1 hypothetical protein FW415_09740 [Chitinophaga sp. XS-30]